MSLSIPTTTQPSRAKRLTVSDPITPAEPVTRMVRVFDTSSGRFADHPGQATIRRIDPAGWKLRIAGQDAFEEPGILVACDKK